MGLFDKTAALAKEKIKGAFNSTFQTTQGFSTTATGIRNSALEATPELVETAHQGVQVSTEFLAKHVDVESVEAESGKYLGINDDSQPFGTEEVLQDSEVDTTFTEENFYQTQPVCARIVLPYSWLVRWFHIKNFLTLVLNALSVSRGNGYVRLGFWGQYRKPNTLAQSEPLGKRIIVGWLQWLINHAPEQIKGIALEGSDTGDIRLDRRDYTVNPINIGTETGTKGTGTDYTTSDDGFAKGATAIHIIEGSGTVLAGDEIQFADDDTVYTVATGVSAPGTIVLASGLKKAIPASATALTIVTETAADFANLDIPVLDAIQKNIPPQFHENLRIVVGMGIYNYLTKRAIAIVSAAANGIMDANALPQYTAHLNIAGFPIVLDKTAPANMILITRTADGSYAYAALALAGVGGATVNPLLSNSNLVLLRHVKLFKSFMDLAFKSKLVDFSWESIFYGMRHHKAAVLFHPDAIRFFNGTSYKASAVQWQLTKLDQAIAD